MTTGLPLTRVTPAANSFAGDFVPLGRTIHDIGSPLCFLRLNAL
jgi:hypothetical protein